MLVARCFSRSNQLQHQKKGRWKLLGEKEATPGKKNSLNICICIYIYIWIYEYMICIYIYICWPFPQTMPCGEPVGFLLPPPTFGRWFEVYHLETGSVYGVLTAPAVCVCVCISHQGVCDFFSGPCWRKCHQNLQQKGPSDDGSVFLLVATLERMWMVLHLNLANVWRICQGTAIAFPQLARCSNYNKVQLGSNKMGPLRTSEVLWNPRMMRA